MRLFRNGMFVLAALAVCTSAADAGHGNGNARGHYKKQRYRAYYAPQQVYYAPPPVVARACAPRYVTYYPQRTAVVYPTPYVQIGANFGAVSISALFGGRGNYQYGCNFCSAHFTSYGAYENHVHHCDYAPANTRIECRPWDDQGYSQWSGRNMGSCQKSSSRYEDRGDYGYRSRDDGGYDDQYDNRQDDDRPYDDQYDGR